MLNNLKIKFLSEELDNLNEAILQTEKAIAESQSEANYHIGAMQSRYDTFKEEAQYLVDAHKLRLIELNMYKSNCNQLLRQYQNNIEFGSKLSLGNLCILNNDIHRYYFFILPISSKRKFNYLGNNYSVVSNNAPIILPFMYKGIGDFCDVESHFLEDYYIEDIL